MQTPNKNEIDNKSHAAKQSICIEKANFHALLLKQIVVQHVY